MQISIPSVINVTDRENKNRRQFRFLFYPFTNKTYPYHLRQISQSKEKESILLQEIFTFSPARKFFDQAFWRYVRLFCPLNCFFIEPESTFNCAQASAFFFSFVPISSYKPVLHHRAVD